MKKNSLYLLLTLFATLSGIFGIMLIQSQNHVPEKLSEHKGNVLPSGFNDLFAGSGECLMCHDAQTNQSGEFIGIISDWRSTMMASSSKDPFWQAKVSHEGLVNPMHKEVLEDVCTRCHAPVGNFNAHHNGQNLYSADEMRDDPLALDGVQCSVCHQITSATLGNFSGTLEIGTEKKIWGPYTDPFEMPMINNTGYTPEYSDHINNAKLCGACHTLITNTVDLNGIPTGGEFVEQAVFQEWANSSHPASGTTCQTCHVPRIGDAVKISSLPPWLEPRTPFGMHQFAGANVFMTRLLKDFGGQIGVTASTVQLDSTLARSTRMLQYHTLDISLTEESRTADTLFVALLLQNKAGHKFPSGYPSRRAYIELIAHTTDNDTLFHSGKTNEQFDLISENMDFENHHAVINSEEQVQIYEMVMGDVDGEVTTVLERAATHLKDNRIPPQGFTSGHNNYDTVQIAGAALNDENFNHQAGEEGTGSDIVYFHIPMDGSEDAVEIIARVYYQTVSNKWLEHMFTYSSTEIDAFKSYYENSNKTPVLVGFKSLTSAALQNNEYPASGILVFPNPARNELHIDYGNFDVNEISVFTTGGKLHSRLKADQDKGRQIIDVSEYKGIVILKIDVANQSPVIRKVLVY